MNTFWDRLRLGLRVTIPGNFIFTGEDLHVAEDTPVGVGDISITVGADLTLRKSPGGPFTVAGAVDTVRGTYTFQGRRFELQRGGTIRFDGTPQLNPALALTADRLISGIETRVALGGTLRAPTLTLSSVPPLEQADVLSLIVFNQPTNALADQQAQDLAVRAGALAAGFLTAPLTGSLAHALGVDLLAVEPVADAGGAGLRVTIGENFGDRLFVQYSRLFGATNYNEARIEYQIRRYLTLRGVLVDGDTGISRRLFQRLERTGVDLLFFFSY